MPTIPEFLCDHVSLDIDCVDRVYLNGYVPTLQTSGISKLMRISLIQSHAGNNEIDIGNRAQVSRRSH